MILISMNCSDSNERDPPETVSLVLNELVLSAPFQFINLNEIETQDIDLREENIIYSVNREVQDGETFIGFIRSFTRFNGHLYVYDSPANGIFKIDSDGNLIGPLTREGKGPGEHLSVQNLKSNSKYLYAIDVNNARINRYTRGMVTVDPLMEFTAYSAMVSVSLNDERILTENRNSMGFAPVNPEEGLVTISSISNLSDTLSTILPRIIPPGYQPNVYNTPKFSINGRNNMAASYSPLPWLFLFDEHFHHTRTLILEYSVFDDMDLPAMEFFRPMGNEGFGGSIPVNHFRLLDDGELFIIIRNELIRLSPSGTGKYKLTGKYKFNYSGEESMWMMDIVSTDNKHEFYGGNWEYLFRFTLPD
ncbi:MAG: hypothetical protein EA359_10200 [Balneolaceae bacterium]|nr:MAG: hypothetical protein EA359_10200 [Balneolaceae bacterium]